MAMRSVDEIPKTYQRKGERTNSVTTARVKDEENLRSRRHLYIAPKQKGRSLQPQLGFDGAGCLWQGAGQFHGALGT